MSTDDGVLYLRMSSRDQEKSPAQQKAEMLPKCKLAGVRLAAEFQDDGVSGGGMKRRDAYLEMLKFCQKRHKEGKPVGAVVCWDTSRFSRATSIETAHYIWEFQQAGVHRVLTWERWFDFRKEEDRAIFLLQQDFTNNRYLRMLSETILRGKKEVAAAGYFTGGMVPYGFDRLLVDDKGVVRERVLRRDKIALRRKDWHVVLAPIPEDDPDPDRQVERQTAVWLFETFASRTVSQRRLAHELNAKGIPGPGSHYTRTKMAPSSQWTVGSVKRILTNPVYAGVQVVGSVGAGAYHRLVNGEIQPVAPGTPKNRHVDAAQTIQARLEHGGLIGGDLWRQVQDKLQERARKGTFPRSGKYCLPSSILHCGHCGGRMYGATVKPRRADGTAKEYRGYRCGTNVSKPGTCGNYTVPEDTILDMLEKRLLEVYLSEERLEGLERQLIDRTEARHASAPDQVQRLRKRLEALDGEIRQAAQNILRCKDNVDVLNEHLTSVRKKRDKMVKELLEAEKALATPDTQAAVKVRAAFDRLKTLRKRLKNAPKENVAEVVRLLVSRVDVFFEPAQKGKKTWFRFSKGVVKFRPVLDVSENEAHLR